MHAVAHGIGGLRQPFDEPPDEDAGQRAEVLRPPLGVGIRPGCGLVVEHEQPAPPVRALVRPLLGPGEERRLGAQRLGGEVPVKRRPDLALGQAARGRAQQPHEQPVHLDAGVPVEAAVERGMQGARRPRRVPRARLEDALVMRVLALDVRKRHPGQPAGQCGIDLFGHAGRV